jgi:hypothetical protein
MRWNVEFLKNVTYKTGGKLDENQPKLMGYSMHTLKGVKDQ